MNLYIVIILSFLFHTALAFCQSKDEKIDQLMNAYHKNGVFNGAILVSHQGKVIYKKAFGIADREWNVPVTIDTKFKIASLSKPFTALAILQLVQEGKIRLNGTIKDYIPDYSGHLGDSITIHELLTHTSGIRSNLDPKEELVKQRLYHDLRNLITYPETSDLLFEPGTRFEYSNFGYNILAYIIERVSGKPYNVILKENIFNPAEMRSTCQYNNSFIENKLAKGYEYQLLYGYRNADFVDASLTIGSGGLVSTVENLYLFDRALISKTLITNNYLSAIFTPHQPGDYGYGWFISKKEIPGKPDSITIADHAGSIDGFGSYMARILSDSSFVVVLKNQRADTYIDPAFAPDIGKQIISILYGEEVDPPKESIANHIAYLIGNKGIDSSIAEYYHILNNQPGDFNLEESQLNRLGIEMYFKFNMADEALKIFEVNMLQFPKSYNVYDSYAYILMQKKDYMNSIKYYKEGLDVLKKYPEANDLNAVKKDAEQALIYIKEMGEKIK